MGQTLKKDNKCVQSKVRETPEGKTIQGMQNRRIILKYILNK
jgi:hypothetical protein